MELGQVVITAGIAKYMDKGYRDFVLQCLERHNEGDWGDVNEKDWEANDRASEAGERVFSAYNGVGLEVWIITEGDRTTTTILLPEEF